MRSSLIDFELSNSVTTFFRTSIVSHPDSIQSILKIHAEVLISLPIAEIRQHLRPVCRYQWFDPDTGEQPRQQKNHDLAKSALDHPRRVFYVECYTSPYSF